MIAEKRRIDDKLAEMRSRVVVQQEMMAAKTDEREVGGGTEGRGGG
jgi:hypothetical protein